MNARILPLAALAVAFCGCVQENHASPEFMGICANPAPSATGCSYSPTCDQYALFNYAYAPAASPSQDLLVPIEMLNQLANNGDVSTGRVNTNDATIQQWRFEYVLGGSVVLTAAEATNFVLPAGTHKTALVPVVPASLNATMGSLPAGTAFVVNVRAAGRYNDERTFETAPFKVPASVEAASAFTSTLTCTAPAYPAVCPQGGQSATYGCVTPP